MILYHGTNQDFSEIDLRKSKPNKDFGTERAIKTLKRL